VRVFLLLQSLWPPQTTTATPTIGVPRRRWQRGLLLRFLSFTRGFASFVLTSVCSFPSHHGLHVSQRRLPPTPSLEISQPKNTLLSLLILSLCGYWLLIVKSDDGFIGHGLCFSSVVLCWCWCWNFKWMMRVGFYCMIGRMEIEKWRRGLSNFFYQCWIPEISGLWRAWLHL